MSCPALAVPNIGMWNTLIVDFAAMSLFHISTSSVGSRMKEGHYECWPALEDFVDTLPFLVMYSRPVWMYSRIFSSSCANVSTHGARRKREMAAVSWSVAAIHANTSF